MISVAVLSLFLCASAAPYPRSSLPFKQIVLFGDKLSPELEDIRGSVAWPKLVSDQLQLDLVDYSDFQSTTDDSLNEAYDETREGESIAYSTLDQIDEYISLNRHSDLPSTSLFILSSGLDEYLSHDTIIASEVALKVEEGIKRLSEIGAKSFLVVAPPPPAEPADPVDAQDLSDSAADYFAFSLRRTLRLITSRMSTPHSLVSLKSSSSQKAYQIPQKHNSLSKLTAVFVDLYTLYSNILANPSAYGFSDGKSVAVPCGLEERCDTNQRLYQTENHLTNVGHEHIAREVQRKIESGFMPSTSSWDV